MLTRSTRELFNPFKHGSRPLFQGKRQGSSANLQRLLRGICPAWLVFLGCFFVQQYSWAQALPDSLPPLDSLSAAELSAFAGQFAGEAVILGELWVEKAQSATAGRVSREQELALARQDTTRSKADLKPLQDSLKTAKNLEKTAHQQRRQAAKIVEFSAQVANADSAFQRRNLSKSYKQVLELHASLYPPPPKSEPPVAIMLGTSGVTAPSPTDSLPGGEVPPTAAATKKEKKAGPPGKSFKAYDPATDVMLHPPVTPCVLAQNSRDEFSGEIRRETQRAELFRYTNPVIKNYLQGKNHILCEAALGLAGPNLTLQLTFTIQDPNARKAFGNLPKNGVVILKTLEGETITGYNLRADEGTPDPNGQAIVFRGQYSLDRALLKNLRQSGLDKIRIAWGTGYEDYEVHSVDLLQRQAKCLSTPTD